MNNNDEFFQAVDKISYAVEELTESFYQVAMAASNIFELIKEAEKDRENRAINLFVIIHEGV